MNMTMQEVLNKYDKAAEFYLHELKARDRSKTTIKNQFYSVNNFRTFFVQRHEGEDEVSDPKYLDFQAWRDDMEAKGKAMSTINRYMSDVRSFFSVVSNEELEEMRFYEKNPCPARVVPPADKPSEKPYDQILTDEQVSLLWENYNRTSGGRTWKYWPRNYAIIMILLTTEIRNKELLDLRLCDVDFEYGELQVMSGKGNKYRCVDCPEIALSAIKLYLKSGLRPERLSDDDYLFGTTSVQDGFAPCVKGDVWKRGSRNWLSELVARHVKMVTGVENVSTHDLRHVGARLDLHNGMRAEELQAKLGHESLTTTQIYSGKLGVNRKRRTAEGVYAERDYQAERNRMMLEVG